MNLKPLGDRLIVEPLEEEQTTIGGIVLPDTAVEKPQRGNVVAAGPGSRNVDTGDRIPMDVAEGDLVVFSKYGGTEIRIEGTDYLILRESDVLAKVVAAAAKSRAKAKA
jgi:chaperonin GroES